MFKNTDFRSILRAIELILLSVVQLTEPSFAQSLPLTQCSIPRLFIDLSRDYSNQVNAVSFVKFMSDNVVQLRVWEPLSELVAINFHGFNSTPALLDIDLSLTNIRRVPVKSLPHKRLCRGQCYTRVIGESPSKAWQIVQVGSSVKDETGIWLIDKYSVMRLALLFPIDAHWQWSKNESSLLFSYPEQEYGEANILVKLSHTRSPTWVYLPSTVSKTWYSLDEDHNQVVAGIPITKTYSLGVFDFRIGQIRSIIGQFNNAAAPFWSETQNQMMSISTQISNTIIYDNKGHAIYDLPTLIEQGSLVGAKVAISPHKDRIVIASNFKRIYVYDCG